MSKYQTFVFKDYSFDAESGRLLLTYGYDSDVTFTETYKFDFPFVQYDEAALDRALQLLFFMAGVSYFKAYMAPKITIEKCQLDKPTAEFLQRTYQKGLGEFFYTNGLKPDTDIPFEANIEEAETLKAQSYTGQLIGLGGGKDSLVSVEMLRGEQKWATWSVGHRSQLEPLVERINHTHLWIERQWDPTLLEHNKEGALNGHVPISAILACVGTVVSILSGYRDVVVSNENSANEPTLQYEGQDINHQYSKSLEFEKDYQQILAHHFGDSLRYYSSLRPLSELRIAELFARFALEKYMYVFSSCNRAFTYENHHLYWCGECPKCAFVFLALTPFVPRSELEKLFGTNLLLKPELEQTYRQLLGIAGDKPLECVGEIKESRAAMRAAQQIYPELSRYEFSLPSDYDYRAESADSMPPEIRHRLDSAISALKSS